LIVKKRDFYRKEERGRREGIFKVREVLSNPPSKTADLRRRTLKIGIRHGGLKERIRTDKDFFRKKDEKNFRHELTRITQI
jgi:hypothetical protein